MALLNRDDWYDIARDVDWELSYVDREEAFPEEWVGAKGIPLDAWEDWDEPYRVSYREYVMVQREKEAGVSAVREAMQRALDYMGLKPGQRMEELAIDAAFIGSCTNARLPDLRAAARILRGRRVAENVKAICVPGSMAVRAAAEAEGLHRVFEAAGFEWQESGCAMCFYAGGEGFGGMRAVSSTNRNFENRQGPGARTHLASPATVAASAVRGRLADPRELLA